LITKKLHLKPQPKQEKMLLPLQRMRDWLQRLKLQKPLKKLLTTLQQLH
jgi:hypothetical protein